MTYRITVHTQPNCTQCTATKRWLTKRHIGFAEAAITDENRAEFTDKGFQSAPVVIAEIDGKKYEWSGLSIGNLEAINELIGEAA